MLFISTISSKYNHYGRSCRLENCTPLITYLLNMLLIKSNDFKIYGQTRTDINCGIKYHFPVITIQALSIKLHTPYKSSSCYNTTRARKLFYEFFYLDSLGIAYQFYSSWRTDMLNSIAKTHW